MDLGDAREERMSETATTATTAAAIRRASRSPGPREAITFFNPLEEREADQAPLQWPLIQRIFSYTGPYAAKRNWLFILTFIRGINCPRWRV